jgi:uncharacterized lipoprotein YddW (UPF0748 family)
MKPFRWIALATLVVFAYAPLEAAHAGPGGFVPPPVLREFRAVWITPISDGGPSDWPSRPGLSIEQQKAELRALLDCAQQAGLNAVIMHVRTAGDALYPTKLAPWSAFLTGVSGKDPGYDPLGFAIAEAHARGLQFHAWFNPFRAMLSNFAGRAASDHITKVHPEWIRRYGTQRWIDPGIPAARKVVLDAVAEVVRRYDVDGVHIDDYFYPYRESETVVKRVRGKKVRVRRDIAFPDDATWKKYGAKGGWTSRHDWRRANVNEFVRALYTMVKKEKSWVAVGVSPFGIWRSGTAGITGLDAYHEIYADSRLWLREGWLDYIAPQLYWSLNGVQSRFTVLDSWWTTQNPKQRYVWPGLATWNVERIGWPESEITDEVSVIRNVRLMMGELPGHVHFRAGSLTRGGSALAAELRDGVYADLALVPPFEWSNGRAPARPVISATPPMTPNPKAVTITAGDTVTVAWWLIQTLGPDGRWNASVKRSSNVRHATISLDTAGLKALAVSPLNRSGQQGPAVTLSW